MVTIHGVQRCLKQLCTNTLVSWAIHLNVACLSMIFVPTITFVMIGSQAIVVNSGTLFLTIKCPDSSETCCIEDSPSENHTLISKGQCSNACNRLGWDWFNFIADESSTQRGTGTCQLFATEPQNLTRSSSCTAYEKASVTLMDRMDVSICKSYDNQSVQPFLVDALTLPQGYRSRASALFNGQLFYFNGTRVYTYDTIAMRLNGKLNIDGLGGGTYGLAINTHNGNLYASVYDNNLVTWMNLENPVVKGSWNVISPYGLSINDIGNVIVASGSPNTYVTEYTPGGTLLKQIPLDINVDPWQAVELRNNTFVVTSPGFGLHSVFTTTSTGQVINSYGSSAGSGAAQMNQLCGVVVDDNGFFIVADRGNNRVLVFNPSLSDVCHLPIPSYVNLTKPGSLSYDQESGRLYVGEIGDWIMLERLARV